MGEGTGTLSKGVKREGNLRNALVEKGGIFPGVLLAFVLFLKAAMPKAQFAFD